MLLTLGTLETDIVFNNSKLILNEFVRAFENLDIVKLEQLILNEDEKIGVLNKWQFLQEYKEHFEDLQTDGINRLQAFKDKCTCYPDKISVGFKSSRAAKETGIIFSVENNDVICISWCNYMIFSGVKIDNSKPFFDNE